MTSMSERGSKIKEAGNMQPWNSKVKNQIALERATHKSTHGSSEPNYKILLVLVLDVVVVLRWHLHEVASCARVEEVVHCSGRSGKAVKTEIVNGGENMSLRNN